MRKTFILFFGTLLIAFTSCNKEETANNNTNNSSLEATWNLQLWDGAPVTKPGTLVFTSNSVNFTYGTSTETDTYVKTGSMVTFTKTGGTVNWLSGGNVWVIDSLTSNVLRMHSKFNLIVRCTR